MKKFIATALSFSLFFGFSQIGHAQHYVKPKETMYSIAKEHKMSLKDLISLNPHIANPNKIQVDDYIVIRSGSETKKDLTDFARSLQSVTAYSYGGQNAPYSTDCSGWVQFIYKKFGVNLPRTSALQANTGKPVKFADLQIGDLMFFSTRADKKISHVGINLGNDFFISNLNSAKDVEILSNWGMWSQKHFMWGTRYEM
jgi:cell wall-associated NlpC family hydrolase